MAGHAAHAIIVGASLAGLASAAALADRFDGCRHVVAGVPPDGHRGGFAVVVEDRRCLVTLVGVLGERPPTSTGSSHMHGPSSTVFFRQVKPMIDAAWTMSTSADLGHAEIEEPRTIAWRLLDRYVSRLLRTGHHDPVVANTYLRVISLVAPMQQILHPRIAWARVQAAPR